MPFRDRVGRRGNRTSSPSRKICPAVGVRAGRTAFRRSRSARRRPGRRSRPPRPARTSKLTSCRGGRRTALRPQRHVAKFVVAGLRLRSSLRPIIICVTSSSLVSAVFERAAILTVAQNADAVGHLEDLFHPVRDVDDPDALRLQILDHVEQHHLSRHRSATRWARRRSRPWRHGSARARSRPSAGWRWTDRPTRVRASKPTFSFCRIASVFRPAFPSRPTEALARQLAQIDVLGHRQFLGEAEFLVDEHDALGLGLQRASFITVSLDDDAAARRAGRCRRAPSSAWTCRRRSRPSGRAPRPA
jgi:hypothetical protein